MIYFFLINRLLKHFRGNQNKKLNLLLSIGSAYLEFPRFNQSCCMNEYNYLYAISADKNTNLTDKIIKINLTNGTHVEWKKAHCFPSEPLFIPKPQAQHEDDGVLLSIVLKVRVRIFGGHLFSLLKIFFWPIEFALWFITTAFIFYP